MMLSTNCHSPHAFPGCFTLASLASFLDHKNSFLKEYGNGSVSTNVEKYN